MLLQDMKMEEYKKFMDFHFNPENNVNARLLSSLTPYFSKLLLGRRQKNIWVWDGTGATREFNSEQVKMANNHINSDRKKLRFAPLFASVYAWR